MSTDSLSVRSASTLSTMISRDAEPRSSRGARATASDAVHGAASRKAETVSPTIHYQDSSATTATPTATATPISTATASAYPRASLPSYFYPQFLVPSRVVHRHRLHLHTVQQRHNLQDDHHPDHSQDLPQTSQHNLQYRPVGNLFTCCQKTPLTHPPHITHILRSDSTSQPRRGIGMASSIAGVELPDWRADCMVALFVCLFVGMLWTVLVGLINSPPWTWRSGEMDESTVKEGTKKEQGKGDKGWENKVKKHEETGLGWRSRLFMFVKGNDSKRGRSKRKQKPIDKPSKFARMPSDSTIVLPTSGDGVAKKAIAMEQVGLAITTATPRRLGYAGNDDHNETHGRSMRKRYIARPSQEFHIAITEQEQLPSAPVAPTWPLQTTLEKTSPAHIYMREHPRPQYVRSNPSTEPSAPAIRVKSNTERVAEAETAVSRSPFSPENPFLSTPETLGLRTRSSAEFLDAHAKFFGSSPRFHTPNPTLTDGQSRHPSSTIPSFLPRSSTSSTSPVSPTNSASYFPSANFSMSDLEAQPTQPTHRRATSESRVQVGGGMLGAGLLEAPNGNPPMNKKRWSATDLLDTVDGAVNWGVEKMVKWTEQGTGEKGLLLPLKRERRGRE